MRVGRRSSAVKGDGHLISPASDAIAPRHQYSQALHSVSRNEIAERTRGFQQVLATPSEERPSQRCLLLLLQINRTRTTGLGEVSRRSRLRNGHPPAATNDVLRSPSYFLLPSTISLTPPPRTHPSRSAPLASHGGARRGRAARIPRGRRAERQGRAVESQAWPGECWLHPGRRREERLRRRTRIVSR